MSQISRTVAEEGIYYTYNGNRAGPFTPMQEALIEFDTDTLPKALGVSEKELLVFRVNQRPTHLRLSKESKPHVVAQMLLDMDAYRTLKDTGEVLRL